jgi:hypothetical protein
MEIITKQLKAMLHIETYLPWENPQRRRNYIGKVQRRQQNYVPTPQRNPTCEKNLNASEKRTLLG